MTKRNLKISSPFNPKSPAGHENPSKDLAEIEALRLAPDGSGVGYLDGKTTFVRGLLPGEKGRIFLTESKKKYQRAETVSIENPSPLRKEPPCVIYHECGGCELQHLNYEAALAWKRSWVLDSLERIGGFKQIPVEPVIGMANPWRYRNKVLLHRDQAGRFGYYRLKSNDVVPFPDCLLLPEKTNARIKKLQELMGPGFPQIKTAIFRESNRGKGMLLMEGNTRNTNEEWTGLRERKNQRKPESLKALESMKDLESLKELKSMKDLESLKELKSMRDLESLKDLESLIKRMKLDSEFSPNIFSIVIPEGEKGFTGSGAPFLNEHLDGIRFKVSPRSFLQVNPVQTAVLYKLVLDYANLQGTEEVLDLYCGVGTITLMLAKRAARATGIEENSSAVQDAIENARDNGIHNVHFLQGKVEREIGKLMQRPDLVVTDPPRAGMEPRVCEQLLRLKPKRIIYVSCDPATLARDLKILTGGESNMEGTPGGSYRIEKVQPVDMFPWTTHVETVVLMSRVEK